MVQRVASRGPGPQHRGLCPGWGSRPARVRRGPRAGALLLWGHAAVLLQRGLSLDFVGLRSGFLVKRRFWYDKKT